MKISIRTALKNSAAPVVLCAALLASPAYAQAAKPAPTAEDTGTIVVTGSILRRTSTETASPVTTVTAASLDQRGISTVQDGLQTLAVNNGPALTNSFTANGAFAAGASAVSLRGLSTNSTLVLFDGLRASYYPLADDGSRNFVDLNTVPDDIVDHIDVLKDGASSAYGADAIAGVVNIITKKQFKGVSARLEGGISSRGDAGTQRFAITAGFGDLEKNGFNVYFSGSYYKSDALYNNARPYPYNSADARAICSPDGTSCGPNNVLGGLNAAGAYDQGTPTASAFYVRPYNSTNTAAIPGGRYQVENPTGCVGTVYTLTAADLAANPTSPTTVCQADYTLNYGAIAPKIERYTFSTRATVKVSDAVEAYIEMNFLQSTSSYNGSPAVIRGNAPTGIFYPRFSTSTAVNSTLSAGSGIIALPVYICPRLAGVSAVMVNGVPTIPGCTAANGTLNPNNPFAAAGNVARLVGRDLQTVTYNETRTRAYRGAMGFSGKLTDKIAFDLGFTAMHTDLRRTAAGYVQIQHLLDVIADGTYNFTNPSATSASVLGYLKPTDVTPASSDQVQLQGSLNTDLFQLPGGAAQLAVGGSIRYEAVDAPSANSDINGPTQRYFTLNAFGTTGKRWISSAYFELAAPLFTGMEANAAGRYDHYSSGQSAFSPKVGIKYKVMKQLLLRGTWSKGFRIPSFAEANALPTTGYVTNNASLFNNTYLAQYGCTTATFSACPIYIRNGSYGQTSVASPGLKPEHSQSFTAGLVFEPFRSLSLTVDYYHIVKTDVITQPSNAPALLAYYTGAAIPAGYTVIADAPDPNFLLAKPRVAFVEAQLINANKLTTSGVDVNVEFKHKLTDSIKWTSSLDVSYIIKLEQDLTASGGGIERYDGTLGNFNLTAGSGTPKWKGTWLNAFDFGDHVKMTAIANYFGGYNLSAQDQGTGYNDCGLNPGYSPTGCNVPHYLTLDLNAQIKVNDRFTLYGTMTNVFDALPPIDVVTYGAHNYNPVQGGNGILGRYFKIGAKVTY